MQNSKFTNSIRALKKLCYFVLCKFPLVVCRKIITAKKTAGYLFGQPAELNLFERRC